MKILPVIHPQLTLVANASGVTLKVAPKKTSRNLAELIGMLRHNGPQLPTEELCAPVDYSVVQESETVAHALDWYAQGADFADALPLAVCGAAVMQTFDRDFCKAARDAGLAPEVRVWAV